MGGRAAASGQARAANGTLAARSAAGWRLRLVVVAAIAAISVSLGCRPAVSSYRPHDPMLRTLPLYFYPSTDHDRAPRAVVFFFGNDVGFWEAHQQLAERLADDDYSVVGFDVKRFLGSLPDAPAARDSA